MKRTDIEGSAARIADRGRDQLFGDALGGKEEALNSLSVVESVVRSFMGAVIATRIAYNKDEVTDAQARDTVKGLADTYAGIFMGKAEGYSYSAWNSPEQLGRFLNESMGGVSTPEDAARDFLLYIARELLAVLVDYEQGKVDDDAGQFRTDALVEDAVHALLGLPAEEPPI